MGRAKARPPDPSLNSVNHDLERLLKTINDQIKVV